jgi:hypothetical protein
MHDHDDAHRRHFDALTRREQEAAIRRLAAEGLGDYELVAASGWAVEAIRSLLGERAVSK